MENLSILTGDIRLGRLVIFAMKHSVLTFALGLCIATPWMKAADAPKIADFSGVWTTTANIDEFDSVVDLFDSTGALSAFEARHLLSIVRTMVKTNVRINPTRLGHLWESVFFLFV